MSRKPSAARERGTRQREGSAEPRTITPSCKCAASLWLLLTAAGKRKDRAQGERETQLLGKTSASNRAACVEREREER